MEVLLLLHPLWSALQSNVTHQSLILLLQSSLITTAPEGPYVAIRIYMHVYAGRCNNFIDFRKLNML